MAYKLYVDRNENFACEVSVKNASLKGSIARLVVESDSGINLVFNGKIENGKCNIPVRRLKGLLEENSTGKMSLEIIIEDTFFKPWVSEFLVEEHTSVKVKIEEQKSQFKPVVMVNVKTPSATPKLHQGTFELLTICERFKITRKSIVKKSNDFRQILKEYFISNVEYNENRKEILNQLSLVLK